jgi:hypothetical protein
VNVKLSLMSALVVPVAAAAVLIAGTGSANASTGAQPSVTRAPNVIDAIGLPYTMRVTGLSGGSQGVKSPVFATNSTGRLCVDPALVNEHNANSGVNNSNFRIEVYKDNSLSDDLQRTMQFTLSSQIKSCVGGLTTNHNYYIRVKKNVFVEGQLMGGTVVISYS